ncbi:hypothetical protein TUN205_11212, partial [Pyrenophora tritici-repentis]
WLPGCPKRSQGISPMADNAQQAAADRQKQQEIEFLSQQTKLHEDHAKQRASQKMRLERELRESRQ